MSERAAIVGLGLIGSIWARHLRADGVLGAVWNRTPKEEFHEIACELEAVPSQVSVVHVCVSDEEAASAVLARLAPGLTAQHLVVQSTTIDPDTSERCGRLVESQGARYLEAPFTGSTPGALSRTTVFYLGGKPEVLARAAPYLSRLSKVQLHLGSERQACAVKLALNLQFSAQVIALAEGLTLARGEEVSDDRFFEALRSTLGSSKLLELKETAMRTGSFPAAFSIANMAKDMRLLSTMSSPTPTLLAAVRAVLEKGVAAGLGAEDYAAVVKLLSTPVREG